MELKQYQRRVLNNLRDYLRLYSHFGEARQAYDTLLTNDGSIPGKDGVPLYKDDLNGVPKVCIKVPTGGGKTFIAANALSVICDELPESPADVVVWLVPRTEILRQTMRQLNDPSSSLRLAIDADFAHRVEVLDKEDGLRGRGFTRLTVEDQLTIFVLSYDSFKNAKDKRLAYAENSALMQLTDYQRMTGQSFDVEGADDTALISALAGCNPIVVVDESHHVKSDLSLEMLQNLNPRFVLELTATPRPGSNVISRVTASELKDEEMVKLPVIVYRRHDKRDVIQDAFLLQRKLEAEAALAEEQGGGYIRPIVLVQAERKGSEDAETYAKLKQKLVDAEIPEEQIAIRTGDKDELKDIDLMSRSCPIRYVITVEALSEGWDCPFAYILASVANKSSKVSVEQIVGRILRQPYARRSARRALNISYVLTSSADFNDTIDQVVSGLNGAGFSQHDVVESDVAPIPRPNPINASQGSLFDESESEDDLSDFEFSFPKDDWRPDEAQQQGSSPEPAPEPDDIDEIIRDAERAEEVFENDAAKHEHVPGTTTGVAGDKNVYCMRAAVSDEAAALRIPQFLFRRRSAGGLWPDDEFRLLDRKNLLDNFNLETCGIGGVKFDASSYVAARQVDVSDETGELKVKKLEEQIGADMRALFSRLSPESKRASVLEGLMKCMSSQFKNTYGDCGVRNFTGRAVSLMTGEQMDAFYDNASLYAAAIVNEVQRLASEHQKEEFKKRLMTGSVVIEPHYAFPAAFAQKSPLTIYEQTLYEAEDGDINDLERNMAETLANSEGIRWWHRVVEQKEGEFKINGFINHYPDFLAMTRGGTLLAIETKGGQLKDDARTKLELGQKWADLAGSGYRYLMVFESDASDVEGAYTLAGFKQFLSDLL